MKKLFPILSAISFMLYALVDFGKNALETYLHNQLIIDKGFSPLGGYYLVDAGMCQTVLLSVGVICLVAFVASFFVKDKE